MESKARKKSAVTRRSLDHPARHPYRHGADPSPTKIGKASRDHANMIEALEPREAMSAARERMISSVPIMLPPIVAIRSGTTDESGRIMRMPVFGPQDTSENDVTYRSDLRKSFPPAAVDLPRLQMMESEPSRTICANLSLPHDWSQASLESQDSKAEYYDLNWKHLEVKLPYTATHAMHSYLHKSIHEDIIAFFSMQEGDNAIMYSSQEPVAFDVHLCQKPSSRRQAQRLAMWLSQFIDGMVLRTQRRGEKIPPQGASAQDNGRKAASPSPLPKLHALQDGGRTETEEDAEQRALNSARLLEREILDHKAKKDLVTASLAYLKSSGILGVVSSDASSWPTFVQALSVCCAFLVQQVGIHCYERGALLTQVWNIYTELMDYRFADLRETVLSAQSFRKQNKDLADQLHQAKAAAEKAQQRNSEHTRELQSQVGDLHSRLSGAIIERDNIMEENSNLEQEIEALKKTILGLESKLAEKDAQIDRLQHDNDLLVTSITGMTGGHENMMSIMPDIRKGVDETFKAVDIMVKRTKAVTFGSARSKEHQDLMQSVIDQQRVATQVKAASNKLEGELQRLLAMGELADNNVKGPDPEPEPEPEPEPSSSEEEEDNDVPPPDVAEAETQTPSEWMPDASESDSSSDYVEEADFCDECGRKMDACKQCFKPSPYAAAAAVLETETVIHKETVIRDTAREAELEAMVSELKSSNRFFKQELANWQQHVEDLNAAAAESRAGLPAPIQAGPPQPLGAPPPPPAGAVQAMKSRVKSMNDGQKITSGIHPVEMAMSTDPELVRELKLDLERLHAEVEDLRGKLKKQTSETAKGVMNSSLSAEKTKKTSDPPSAPATTARRVPDPADKRKPPESKQAPAPKAEGSNSKLKKAPPPPQVQITAGPKAKKTEESEELQEAEAETETEKDLPRGLGPSMFKNRNMIEAIEKYKAPKSRPANWLLMFVEKIYKAKYQQDIARARDGQALLSLPDFLFQHLQGTYGTRMLVLEYVSQIIATLNKFRAKDTRLQVFHKFLSEEWGTSVLEVFLHARAMLAETCAIACLEFPNEYGSKGASSLICTRKAMNVGDLLLMERPRETMRSFRDIVDRKAEPATAAEVRKFIFNPNAGNQQAPIQDQIAQEESAAGPFLKIPTIAFLQELCQEFHRCEGILEAQAPELFKKYDYNSNGQLEYRELRDILRQLQLEFREAFMEEHAIQMWRKAVAIQIQGEVAKGGTPRDPDEVQCIGITAFREAALESPVVRRYVRLFMTPPPVDTGDAEAIGMQKMLAMVVARHWRLYGHYIEEVLPHTGANQMTLVGLIARLKTRELDGTEKCGLWCRILKFMCDSKLEDLQAQCAPDHLTSYDETLENNLQKLAVSLQVLYGKQCLMEDDFPRVSEKAKQGLDSRSSIQRLVFYNAVKFRAEDYAARVIQNKFNQRGKSKAKLGNIFKSATDPLRLASKQSQRPLSHPVDAGTTYQELEDCELVQAEPPVIVSSEQEPVMPKVKNPEYYSQ